MKTNDTFGLLAMLGIGTVIYISVSSCSQAAKKTPLPIPSPAPQTAPVPVVAPQTPPPQTASTVVSPAPNHKEFYIQGTPVLTVVETKSNPTINCTFCLKCHKQ